MGYKVIENDDKWWMEKWTRDRRPENIPHSFRCLCIGRPHSGKGVLAKNLVLHQRPSFTRVVIWSISPESTVEWEDLRPCEIVSSCPEPESFEREVLIEEGEEGYVEGKDKMRPEKSCFIVDDVDLKGVSKTDHQNLHKILKFASSHNSVSVILTAQDCFGIPPLYRRLFNCLALWKIGDLDSCVNVARKFGMKKEDLLELFETVLGDDYHAFLFFDDTIGSPYPLRKNLNTVLTRE